MKEKRSKISQSRLPQGLTGTRRRHSPGAHGTSFGAADGMSCVGGLGAIRTLDATAPSWEAAAVYSSSPGAARIREPSIGLVRRFAPSADGRKAV